MKNILIKIRSWIKFLVLVSVGTFIIAGIVALFFNPKYSVTLNGELIGYCSRKSELQTKIDEYIENGNGDNSNLAFVQIQSMPQYKMCLLKRNIETNDDEIFAKVTENGTPYYKYYAVLEDSEEKAYVSDFATAEAIAEELKEKNSDNIDKLTIIEKYETELKDFISKEEAVANLYKEKPVVVKQVTVAKATSSSSSGSFSTSRNMSQSTISLGVSLIKPITGTISSRFGASSSIRSGAHTGLDIASSTGSPIKAAASGTVTFAGWKGSYGNLLVITHSNGVQTYYGHCSKLYVSAGQKVSQGQKVAAVGSTGNSTGPHLHFEIRVNGVAYNPQKYVY